MRNLYAIKNKLDSILGTDISVNLAENDAAVSDSELNMLLDDEVNSYSVNEHDLEPLVALIRSWVIDHVIGSDIKLKPYLVKRPLDFQ